MTRPQPLPRPRRATPAVPNAERPPGTPDPGTAPEPDLDLAADPGGSLAADPGGSLAADPGGDLAADLGLDLAADPAQQPRPTTLQLARVHLRMGSLGLARAELEAMAGRGALDEPALLDLAEVRWRTGDLAGAGEAAATLLERGREDLLALVIAAEAVAAEGRPGEARRLAGRAMALADRPLDEVFAGLPRSAGWPVPSPIGAAAGHEPAAPEAGAGQRRLRPAPAGHAEHAGHAGPALPSAASLADPDAPATTAAAEAFAGGRAALGGGDLHAAALRLGVALRLEPAFAEAVLDAIGDRAADPWLALVAGDAFRLLGRETEALAAFDVARGHGSGVTATEGPPAG